MSEEVKDPDLLKKLNGGTAAATVPEHPALRIAKRSMQALGDVSRGIMEGATFGAVNAIPAGISSIAHGTKFANELAKQNEESRIARARTPWGFGLGNVAGSALPGATASKAVGATIKPLAGIAIPRIMGNQAVTGAGMSAADAVAHGETPDPRKMVISGGASALLSGPLAVGARLFPGPRARFAGNELTGADKSNISGFLDKSKQLGVPLNIPEAASAVAPQRATGLNSTFNSASRLHEGAHELNAFNAERIPVIEQTAKRTAGMLANVHPVEAQKAATTAIHDAENLVSSSAKPYYTKANPDTVFPGLPKDPGVRKAAKQIESDPVLKAETKNAPKGSIQYLDMVRSRLQRYEKDALGKGDTFLAKLYRDKHKSLGEKMRDASDNYDIAEDIYGQGHNQLVGPLASGPLGTISKTANLDTQAGALFNIGTGSEAAASINAAKRMPGHVAEGLLAHRIEDAAARDPLGFSRSVLPSDASVGVARQAVGSKFGQIEDTLASLRAVRPADRTPVLESHSGLWHDTVRALQRASAQGTVRRLNDPAFVPKLGQMAPLQALLHGMSASQIADYLQKLKIRSP